MTIINRYLKLLEFLSIRKTVHVQELANLLSISSQTVVNSVEFLAEEYSDIFSLAIQKKIVYLTIHDMESFQRLVYGGMKEEADYNSQGKRTAYILHQLIDRENFLNTEEIAFDLMVSRGTVVNDLKVIRQLVEEFGGEIEGKSSRGIRLKADEYTKRLLLLYFIYDYFPQNISEYDAKRIEELEQLFELDLETRQLFEKNWSISLNRINQEKNLTTLPKYYTNYLKQEEHLDALVVDIEVNHELNFSKTEVDYLYFPLSLKNTIQRNFSVKLPKSIRQIVFKIFEELAEEFGLKMRAGEMLEQTEFHLSFLLNRLSFHFESRDLFFESVAETYPFSYKVSEYFCKRLGNEIGRRVPLIEVGYLAIYFELSLRSRYEERVKKVAIIGSIGQGLKQVVKEKIFRLFGSDTQIDILSSKCDIEEKLNDYLVAFTNSLFTQQSLRTPIYSFHELLNERQLLKFQFAEEEKSECFLEWIEAEVIEGISYEENLERCIECLSNQGILDEQFYERLSEREKLRTTVEPPFAFPHTINSKSEQLVLIFGKSSEGLESHFGKVHFFLLLCIPEEMDEEKERVLLQVYEVVFRLFRRYILQNGKKQLPTIDELKDLVEAS
ncbi:lichenan operon transcriptional antiterminator [Pilibacter termitis]|uniref:Lichenan operon transcriptional antiterminator n=1 Tax=Pilibacter termitis TaxID=263852 RepID=A0A1T4N5D5_9ENTE|nr:HTH domain-containing protein [Pilibacter termitis]SJZ74453.1 lichenan operon transcriptional antiterminator [Pilibacter termitis]